MSEICFFFWFSKNWPSGGTGEVVDDTANWFPVYDSGRGSAFGTGDGTQRVPSQRVCPIRAHHRVLPASLHGQSPREHRSILSLSSVCQLRRFSPLPSGSEA